MEAAVLPKLYGRVVIPQAVLEELLHPSAPRAVREWIAHTPSWLVIERGAPSLPDLPSDLDLGECEAIALAQANLPDALLLIDENRGRHEAERRRIQTTGTLGVLDAAATQGLLDLPGALRSLQGTNFYVSQAILQRLLDRDAQRKRTRDQSE